MATKTRNKNHSLRDLPSIDRLLRTTTATSLRAVTGSEQLTNLARQVTDEMRGEISAAGIQEFDKEKSPRESLLAEAARRLSALHSQEASRALTRVINATGVVLHTNLGRAPLSEAARRALLNAAGYCNLEFDLAAGVRGRRGARAEDLLVTVTGAESALIVNNCAAAALLILTVLAREGETLVSRGELVEIGGDFRVPEVMSQSGTRMIEVGTTNRTRVTDYSRGISEHTRLIMRVHPSNYRIVGFTSAPKLSELADVAHNAGLVLYEDAGSGALLDLAEYGIEGEPIVRASISDGADVVSFSGDKLLGGPQVGCIVGRSNIIERLRQYPLYRALRADKLRIAALEATLDAYVRDSSLHEVPALRSITATKAELEARANGIIDRIRTNSKDNSTTFKVISGESAIGGGAAPISPMPTMLISVRHEDLSANQIEASLRRGKPPVIARILEDQVVLDLRTVAESEETELEEALLSALST